MNHRIKGKNILLFDGSGKPLQPVATTYTSARSDRLTNDMPLREYLPREAIQRDLKRLRARAQFLERNNDLVRRFLYLCEVNIVGPNGIRMQSRARRSPTGSALDVRAVQLTETHWKDWTKKRNCTTTQQLSWRCLLKMLVRRRRVDGEFFVEMVPGFPGNGYNYALRVYEPDQIDLTLTDREKRIEFGIEYSKDWAPVRYFIRDPHGETELGGRQYYAVPAARMIHGFRQERPGQRRGIPEIASPMERLHMLDQIEEATLVGTRIAAAKMGFFRDTTGEYEPYAGSTETGDDDPEAPGGKEYQIEIAPGQFEDIGARDFQAFDPGYPIAGYDEYTSSVIRSLAAGMNISYHKLANDLRSVNYSTAREAKLDDCDHWRDEQNTLIEDVCDPVYDSWVQFLTLRHDDFRPYRTQAHQIGHRIWQPRGWQWVDPQKEATGNRIAMQMGVKSPSEIAADMGKDFEEVIDSIAADVGYAQKKLGPLGLNYLVAALAQEVEPVADEDDAQ